ncbi:hypothetical protein PVAP13_2KG408500 [Panicum virgatum]|uniref:BTB domain-containing protein n=1 Tax=Panicum virgatum TaxID=38727 RepID=A0A8T0W4D8_PANVG|nr:hypothetical protein PVAP13_2KG408500 [Panicum virgatum]
MRTGWRRTEAQSAGLSRMLISDIVVVNAAGGGGGIRAHCTVLAARSPVFAAMFSNGLRETRESAVDISDMSVGACRAFVGYLYGNLREEEFIAHRSELLHAGDKYDVVELKRACEESLLGGRRRPGQRAREAAHRAPVRAADAQEGLLEAAQGFREDFRAPGGFP